MSAQDHNTQQSNTPKHLGAGGRFKDSWRRRPRNWRLNLGVVMVMVALISCVPLYAVAVDSGSDAMASLAAETLSTKAQGSGDSGLKAQGAATSYEVKWKLADGFDDVKLDADKADTTADEGTAYKNLKAPKLVPADDGQTLADLGYTGEIQWSPKLDDADKKIAKDVEFVGTPVKAGAAAEVASGDEAGGEADEAAAQATYRITWQLAGGYQDEPIALDDANATTEAKAGTSYISLTAPTLVATGDEGLADMGYTGKLNWSPVLDADGKVSGDVTFVGVPVEGGLEAQNAGYTITWKLVSGYDDVKLDTSAATTVAAVGAKYSELTAPTLASNTDGKTLEDLGYSGTIMWSPPISGEKVVNSSVEFIGTPSTNGGTFKPVDNAEYTFYPDASWAPPIAKYGIAKLSASNDRTYKDAKLYDVEGNLVDTPNGVTVVDSVHTNSNGYVAEWGKSRNPVETISPTTVSPEEGDMGVVRKHGSSDLAGATLVKGMTGDEKTNLQLFRANGYHVLNWFLLNPVRMDPTASVVDANANKEGLSEGNENDIVRMAIPDMMKVDYSENTTFNKEVDGGLPLSSNNTIVNTSVYASWALNTYRIVAVMPWAVENKEDENTRVGVAKLWDSSEKDTIFYWTSPVTISLSVDEGSITLESVDSDATANYLGEIDPEAFVGEGVIWERVSLEKNTSGNYTLVPYGETAVTNGTPFWEIVNASNSTAPDVDPWDSETNQPKPVYLEPFIGVTYLPGAYYERNESGEVLSTIPASGGSSALFPLVYSYSDPSVGFNDHTIEEMIEDYGFYDADSFRGVIQDSEGTPSSTYSIAANAAAADITPPYDGINQYEFDHWDKVTRTWVEADEEAGETEGHWEESTEKYTDTSVGSNGYLDASVTLRAVWKKATEKTQYSVTFGVEGGHETAPAAEPIPNPVDPTTFTVSDKNVPTYAPDIEGTPGRWDKYVWNKDTEKFDGPTTLDGTPEGQTITNDTLFVRVFETVEEKTVSGTYAPAEEYKDEIELIPAEDSDLNWTGKNTQYGNGLDNVPASFKRKAESTLTSEEFTAKYGANPTIASWSPSLDTNLSQGLVFKATPTKQTKDVKVTVTDGTLGGESSFTVTGVEYGTLLSDIKVNADEDGNVTFSDGKIAYDPKGKSLSELAMGGTKGKNAGKWGWSGDGTSASSDASGQDELSDSVYVTGINGTAAITFVFDAGTVEVTWQLANNDLFSDAEVDLADATTTVNYGTSVTDLAKFTGITKPGIKAKNGTLDTTNKYQGTSANEIDWDLTSPETGTATTEVVYTGTPKLKTYPVAVMVKDEKGTVTVTGGDANGQTGPSVQLGSEVKYGTKANSLFESLSFSAKAGTGLQDTGSWVGADPNNEETIVTGATNYVYALDEATYTLTVDVTGGTLGGYKQIKVNKVRYGTKIEDVKLGAITTSGAGNDIATCDYSDTGTPLTTLDPVATGPNYVYDKTTHKGTWDPATNTAITDNTTATFTFDGATYDIEIAVDGGTVEGQSSIVIKDVPYGTEYASIKYTKDGDVYKYDKDSSNTIANLSFASSKNSDTGTWSGGTISGPTAAAAPTDTSKFGNAAVQGNATLTFKYDVGNITVTYSIASDYASELTITGGETTSTPYGSSYDTVAGLDKPTVTTSNSAKYGSTPTITWTYKIGDNDFTSGSATGDVTAIGTPELQAYTVTYKVEGGTWDGSDSADQSETVTYDGHPASVPSTASARPLADAANAHYLDDSGKWYDESGNEVIPGTATITGDTTFTWKYTKQYKVTYAIDSTTGTWNGTDSAAKEYYETVGSDGKAKLTGSNIPTNYVPNDGYYDKGKGLSDSSAYSGSWSASTPADGTEISGDTTYTWSFDRYYKVTYKIEGGTWSDGTTADIVEYVKKNGTLNTPTGMKASSGFTGGAWDPTPSSNIDADKEYTYSFTAAKMKYYVTPYYQDLNGSGGVKDAISTSSYTADTPIELSTGDGVDVASTQTLTAEDIAKATAASSGYTLKADLGDQAGATLTIAYKENDQAASPQNTFKVYYTRNSYNLKYAWSGDVPDSGITNPKPADTTKYFGDSYTVAEVPSATHYSFEGWKNGDDEVTGDQTMPASDVTLAGEWSKEKVTIYFVNKDATNTISGQTTLDGEHNGEKGVKLSLAYGADVSVPTKSNTGTNDELVWTSDPAGNTVVVPSTTATESTTYYAKWVSPIRVTYTHDGNATDAFPSMIKALHINDTIPALGDNSPVTPGQYAKPGYTWAKWIVKAGDEAQDDVTDDTATPAGASATVTTYSTNLVYTATYAANSHAITWTPDGGTFAGAAPKNGADHDVTDAEGKTDDTIYLPSASELTKTGYTLTNYTVKQGSESTTANPGSTITIGAGTSPDYKDAIEITANFEINKASISYAHVAPGASGLPALSGTSEESYDTSLTLPELTGNEVKGYHFTGWTATKANGDSIDITNSTNLTGATLTVPDTTSITVNANWEADSYSITWKLDDKYTTQDGFNLDSSSATSTTTYGTAYSAVTAPTANWTADSIAANGYETDITWHIGSADGAELTSDMKFGQKNGQEEGLMANNGDTITLVGVPTAKAGFRVTIEVEGGTFTQGTTTEKTQYTFDNIAYGTSVASLVNAENTGVKDFVPNTGYDEATAVWTRNPSGGDGKAPASTADTVTQNLSYKLTYSKKSYPVAYVVDSSFTDVKFNLPEGSGTYGTAITAPTSATLETANAENLTQDEVGYKYDGTYSWKVMKSDGTPEPLASQTFSDNYVKDGKVTLVATPNYQDYTVTVVVTGGTVTGANEAGDTYTEATQAVVKTGLHYGDSVKDVYNKGSWTYKPSKGHTGDGAWQDGKSPLNENATVGHTSDENAYTYVFAQELQIAFSLTNGTFTYAENELPNGAELTDAGRTLTYKVEAGSNITVPTGFGPDDGYDSVSWSEWTPEIDGDTLTNVQASANYAGGYSKGSYGYTINRYYQKVGTTGESLENDYILYNGSNHLEDGVTLTENKVVNGTATFESTLGVSSQAADVTGFTSAAVKATDKDGRDVTATGISISEVAANNVLNLYFNRETIQYSYRLDAPAGSGISSPQGGTAQYGQTIELEKRADFNGKMFSGWYTSNDMTGDKYSSYTFNSTDNIVFYGTYVSGEWPVSFAINTTSDDPNDKNAYFGDTEGTQSYTSTNTVAWGGSASSVKPTVTSSIPAKYEVVGWTCTVNGEPQMMSDDTTTPKQYKADLSDAVILSAGYEFTPVFGIRTYTITYSGGEHGSYKDSLDPDYTLKTSGATYANGVFTFANVEYGAAMPVPSLEDLRAAGDGFGRPAKDANAEAYTYASNEAWPWTPAKSDTVGASVDYKYDWEKRTFNVYFVDSSVEGEGPITSADDSRVVAVNRGGQTPNLLYWDTSVYYLPSGGAGVESGNKVIQNADDVKKLKKPTKDGYVFAGYSTGTASAPDTGTITTLADDDIRVSMAYSPSLSGTNDIVYLWQNWTGETAQIVFHRNYADGDDKTATQSTQVGATPQLTTLRNLDDFPRTGYTFKGWTTDQAGTTPATPYADGSQGYEVVAKNGDNANKNDLYAQWEANTYTVQWKGFDGNLLTYAQVYAQNPSAVPADKQSSTEPYTQTITYGKGDALTAMKDVVEKTGNTGNKLLANWDYNGTSVADGKTLATASDELSAKAGDVVVLTPASAATATLTYQSGVVDGTTGAVSGMPDPATVTAVKDGSTAEFTLAPAPTRKGYEFKGWKIGGSTSDASTKVNLSAASNIAVAQWQAITDEADGNIASYGVETYFEDASGNGAYTKDATMDATVKAAADSSVTQAATEHSGFTYNRTEILKPDPDDPSKMIPTTTVDADGGTVVRIYYDRNSYDVTYAYSTPDDEATAATPGIDPVKVDYNGKTTLAGLPDAAALPEGYEYTSDDPKWVVDGKEVAAGEEVTITDTTEITLPIQLKTFTVTYVAGENATVEPAEAATTGETVRYGKTPEMKVNGVEVVASKSETGAYEFAGWTSSVTGNVAQPKNVAVTQNIDYTANYLQTFVVTYDPGSHSKDGFKSTGKTTFSDLANPYNWSAYDATDNPDGAALQLAEADLEGGKPAAETGYAFAGWKDDKDTSGAAYTYATLDDLYANAATNTGHTFTAVWTPTEQEIVFTPGSNAATTATAGSAKAATGASFTTPDAPDNQDGYTFLGWKGTLNGVEQTLAPNTSYTMHASPAQSEFVGQWEESKVTLAFRSADTAKGKVSPSGYANIAATSSDEYYSVAKPLPGYKFVGWTSADATKNIDAWYDASITDKTDADYGKLTVKQQGGLYQSDTYTATFEKDPYKVTFEAGDAKAVASFEASYDGGAYQPVDRGQKASTEGDYKVAITPNAGYTLIGYSYVMKVEGDNLRITATENAGPVWPDAVPINGDTVFTALYSYDPAYLAFDGNGSDGGSESAITSITVGETTRDTQVGDTISLPARPGFTRTGYEFAGWSLDKDASYTDADKLVASVTLKAVDGSDANKNTVYAVWKPNAVAVKYYRNDGTETSKVDTTGVVGSDVTAAGAGTFAAPDAKRGSLTVPGTAREFVEWNTAPDGSGTKKYAAGDAIPASEIGTHDADDPYVLYAIWRDKSFNVTYSDGFSSSTAMSGYNRTAEKGNQIVYGETITIPKNEYTRDGYTFNGWNVTADGEMRRVGDASTTSISYTFKGSTDVTIMPNWLSTGEGGKIQVNFYDENKKIITNQAQEPVTSTPFADDPYQSSDANLTFEGWYASSDLANAHNATDALKNLSLLEVLKTYYSTASSVDENKVYWDTEAADFTEAYKNASKVELNVYRGSSLKSYELSFEPNAPAGHDDSEVAKMADQKISVGAGDKLDKNTYEFAGYKFLGWLKEKKDADTSRVYYDQMNPHYEDGYDTSKGEIVTGVTSTKQVLYAAWLKVPNNSVKYVLHYDGDGITNPADEATYGANDGTVGGLAYTDAISYPEGTTAAPTTYDDDANLDVSFVGWYTKPNTPDTTNGVAVTVGSDSTLGGLLDNAGFDGTEAEDGHYDVVLYAKWTRNGVRVNYDKNGGVGDLNAASSTAVLVEKDDTSVTLIENRLSKKGFYPDGWNENAAGTGTSYTNEYKFTEGTEPGTTKTLYAKFLPKKYTVNYVTDTIDGYTGASAKAKDSGNADVVKAENLTWTDDKVDGKVITPAIATDPTKDGYLFKGWYTGNPETDGNAVKVQPGWTVKDLQEAVARANGKSADEAEDGDKTGEDANELSIYAKWEPDTYVLKYDLKGGTLNNGSNPADKRNLEYSWSTADGTASGDPLVLPSNSIKRTGHAFEGNWYLDDSLTTKLTLTDGNASLSDIIKTWRGISGNEHADLPSSFTLYAGWTEDTVEVTFTTQDNGMLAKYGDDDLSSGTATLTYRVGIDSGKIYENGAFTENTLKPVTAAATSGYQVTKWVDQEGNEVAGDTLDLAGVIGNGSYTTNTYTAVVEAASNVGYTVEYYLQKADGTWPTVADATINATDGSTGATLSGADFASSEYTAARTETSGLDFSGLTYDSARTPDATVAANGSTTMRLYFNRGAHEVTFTSVWEGAEPTSKPALPLTRSGQYAGSTQSVSALTAPAGYTFEGWYYGDAAVESAADPTASGTAVTGGADSPKDGSFTMPDKDVVVSAVFKKSSYSVTFNDGIVDDSGNAVSDTSQANLTKVPTAAIMVDRGQTLAGTGAGFKLELVDSEAGATMTLGTEGKADADVTATYDGNSSFITWKYQVNGTGDWLYTDDPSSVAITGNTVFQAVSSTARVVSYLPGEHGTFATSAEANTRVMDIAAGYDMADYPYQGGTAKKAASGPVEASDDSYNKGLPTAEPGWKFAGWEYTYVTSNGRVNTGDTKAAAAAASGADNKMSAGLDALKGLQFSITLTALWEPTDSKLVFDAGTTNGYDAQAPAEWNGNDTSRYYATDKLVRVPDVGYVTRDGFTLSKWTWTDDDGNTYEYAPGTESFQMPGKDKVGETTLTAVWTEDTVDYAYASAEPSMGAVDTTLETVGVWSGKLKGTDNAVAGSTATAANDNYTFVKWTDAEGADVDADAATVTGGKLVPKAGADGKYAGGSFKAQFQGNSTTVTFKSNNDQYGTVTDAEGNALPANYQQTVPYNGSPDMRAVKAAPANNGYELVNWSYVTKDGGTVLKTGTTDDPSKVKVEGDTEFTANFKASTGTYQVNYWMDNPAAAADAAKAFDSVKRGWNDSGLTTGKDAKKTGYTFDGWYAQVPNGSGTTETKVESGDAYGKLAGGDYFATDTTRDHIDLYAKWTEKSGYTLYFDTQGGSDAVPVASTQTVDNQLSGLKWTSVVNNPSNTAFQIGQPARSGYTFAGWWTAPTGGTQYLTGQGTAYSSIAGDNDATDATITLYAHWDDETYKVRYVSADYVKGGAAGTVYATKEFKYEATGLNGQEKPVNANEDDTVWWNGWKYKDMAANGVETGVDASTSVRLLDVNSRNSELFDDVDDDGAFLVYADWQPYYTWTTTYVPFESTDNGATWQEISFEDKRIESQYLVVKQKGKAGDRVAADLGYKVPGFEFGSDARGIMADDWSITDPEGQLVATLSGEDPDFRVAVTTKEGYKVKFDMNAGKEYTEDDYTHNAKTSDGDANYADIEDKTFASDLNTPVFTDADDTVRDVPDPVRKGFDFKGWYNLPVEDNLADADVPANAIKADKESLYGDLAFDAEGTWYDPEDEQSKTLTLHARWTEQKFDVQYALDEGEGQRGYIAWNTDDAEWTDADLSAGDTAIFDEKVGAATGNGAVGVKTKAKRGYHFAGWVVRSNIGKILPVSGTISAQAGAAAEDALAAQAEGLRAQAEGDVEYDFSDSSAITPGVDEENKLFGAEPDTDEHVLYVASFDENALATVTFDKGADDATYTGKESLKQPYGTYVGEKEPWGTGDGELPAASTISRKGYTFKGWSADGGKTVVDDPAKVVIPEGGLTLTAVWEADTYEVTLKPVTLPDGTVLVPGKTIEKEYGSTITASDISGVTPSSSDWTAEKFVVTFYDADGTTVLKTRTVSSLTEIVGEAIYGPIEVVGTWKKTSSSTSTSSTASGSANATTKHGGKSGSGDGAGDGAAKGWLAKTGDDGMALALSLAAVALLAGAVALLAGVVVPASSRGRRRQVD